MRKSDTRCESKQECSSSKADELKVEFSAEWLRIWRYERGTIRFKDRAHSQTLEIEWNTTLLERINNFTSMQITNLHKN